VAALPPFAEFQADPPSSFPCVAPPTSPLAVLPYPVRRHASSPSGGSAGSPQLCLALVCSEGCCHSVRGARARGVSAFSHPHGRLDALKECLALHDGSPGTGGTLLTTIRPARKVLSTSERVSSNEGGSGHREARSQGDSLRQDALRQRGYLVPGRVPVLTTAHDRAEDFSRFPLNLVQTMAYRIGARIVYHTVE